MAERPLTTVAVLAGVACCIGAPVAALGLGGVALGSLGRLSVGSASTPGCEMRSLPHLVTVALPGDRTFVACPGPLQPLDEWEARTTGRAVPHQ